MLAGFDAKPLKRESKRLARRANPRTGIIEMYGGDVAPDGALFCQGQAVSRQVYADLYRRIGTKFGSGDGSTTFNLPNIQDRMPIGAGNLYSVGGSGGSKDAIVVSHTHTATTAITDAGHSHGTQYSVVTNSVYGTSAGGIFPTANSPGSSTTTNTTGITAATTVNSTGSSGTDANLPPYVGVNFIIWT